MKIFDLTIDHVRELLGELSEANRTRVSSFEQGRTWPRGERGEIVLGEDTALELGHPRAESVAFLMWTDSLEKVRDGRITVIGPELGELDRGAQVPFGKVTLIGGHGFDEVNGYERWQKMDELRLSLNLRGHMLRAVPQQNREWSRISTEALKDGLSLEAIGNELLRTYRELDFVDAAEVVFITSSAADVRRLQPSGERARKITSAMNTIFEDLEMDCGSCELSEVCDDIEGLREMHSRVAQADG